MPLQSRSLRGTLRPTSEPRLQQPLPAKRLANHAGRCAEHPNELMTERGVVTVAEVHCELQQRRRLRALQAECGVNRACGL